jgi:hypothetical protein
MDQRLLEDVIDIGIAHEHCSGMMLEIALAIVIVTFQSGVVVLLYGYNHVSVSPFGHLCDCWFLSLMHKGFISNPQA